MSKYKNVALTEEGRDLLLRTQLGECDLELTRVAAGDGIYENEEEASQRLSMQNEKQSFPISSFTKKEDKLQIRFIASNFGSEGGADLQEGYHMREIGIFAKEKDGENEILYGIALAEEPVYMPPYNEASPITATFSIYIYIGGCENVSLRADPTAYVSVQELERIENEINNKADKTYVPSKTGEGASGTWGIDITGNAGTSTKLAASRSIFGKTFNGSADVKGQGSFYGSYNSSAAGRFSSSAFQIRENDLVANTKSDIAYAPSIGFHWSNMTAGTLALGANGNYYFLTQQGTTGTVVANLSGNASSATKLSTSAGSATNPVYFSDGKPVACSYTLGKSVPSNAVFTDTTYGTATESTNGLLSASDKKKLGLIYSASCTKGASTRSTLLGTGNKDNGDENIIAAGYGNTIGNATQSAIIAGSGNNIPVSNTSSWYRNSVILNGHGNYVAGSNVLVAGNNNNAYANQTAFGHFCKLSTLESSDSGSAARTAFMIGNGSSDSSRSNAFRVNYNGTVYATNSTIATGADYAEYFEWADGNPNGEDRVGLFVTFDERDPEKIKTASPGDYILGIVSGHPNTIGNGDEDWRGRYVLDDFGRYIEETYEYEEIWQDKDGAKHTETREGIRYKENPDYDPEEQYIPREERPEWSAIGMVGLLSVYDDGTCQVNGYCRCGENGVATLAEERTFDTYRVIQRINENVIKVVIKP